MVLRGLSILLIGSALLMTSCGGGLGDVLRDALKLQNEFGASKSNVSKSKRNGYRNYKVILDDPVLLPVETDQEAASAAVAYYCHQNLLEAKDKEADDITFKINVLGEGQPGFIDFSNTEIWDTRAYIDMASSFMGCMANGDVERVKGLIDPVFIPDSVQQQLFAGFDAYKAKNQKLTRRVMAGFRRDALSETGQPVMLVYFTSIYEEGDVEHSRLILDDKTLQVVHISIDEF